MNGHRLCLPARLLLAALCVSCGSPIEPVSEEFGSNAPIKLNTPSSPQAAAASHSLISLTWQDNSTNESGFEVYRSTNGGIGTFQPLASTEANATSFGDGGLTTSTEYCYRVRAFRKTGTKVTNSAFSSVACATTSVAPRPAAPSAVTATPQFAGFRVIIGWTDNSTDETGFRVERSASETGPWTAVGTASANATSLQDNQSLPAEQAACYRVFAVNGFGDSDLSNVDCAIVPRAPSNFAANVLVNGTVNLTWTDNTAIEDGYQVLRGDGGGVGLALIATLPIDAAAYQDAGLADGNYGYVVRATKEGGTSENATFLQVIVATVRPTAPTAVFASPAASTSVNVTWVDLATNEDGSRIERSTNHGASWVTAETLGWYLMSGNFQDQALTPEQEVCYRVVTFNRIGDSDPSPMGCTTPPARPTDFTATFVDWDAVDFAWTDNSDVEDGYHILIDFGQGYYGGYWGVVGTVGANETTYRLEGYANAAYQRYFVAAIKDGGYSDFSDLASPTPPALSSNLRAPAPPGFGQPPLSQKEVRRP